jgi:putative endonuclease
MHYTYIIQSRKDGRYYFGSTVDLKKRICIHNEGGSPHTSKFRPWRLKWFAAFPTKKFAEDFEEYLKTGSGYAFSRKRLL